DVISFLNKNNKITTLTINCRQFKNPSELSALLTYLNTSKITNLTLMRTNELELSILQESLKNSNITKLTIVEGKKIKGKPEIATGFEGDVKHLQSILDSNTKLTEFHLVPLINS